MEIKEFNYDSLEKVLSKTIVKNIRTGESFITRYNIRALQDAGWGQNRIRQVIASSCKEYLYTEYFIEVTGEINDKFKLRHYMKKLDTQSYSIRQRFLAVMRAVTKPTRKLEILLEEFNQYYTQKEIYEIFYLISKYYFEKKKAYVNYYNYPKEFALKNMASVNFSLDLPTIPMVCSYLKRHKGDYAQMFKALRKNFKDYSFCNYYITNLYRIKNVRQVLSCLLKDRGYTIYTAADPKTKGAVLAALQYPTDKNEIIIKYSKMTGINIMSLTYSLFLEKMELLLKLK